jgi:hypothetical protein
MFVKLLFPYFLVVWGLYGFVVYEHSHNKWMPLAAAACTAVGLTVVTTIVKKEGI